MAKAILKAGKARYSGLLHFLEVTLMLGACSFDADQIAREGEALPAFGFAAQPGIYIRRLFTAATHRITQFFFPDGIANTYDHGFAFNVNANRLQ